MTDPPRPRSGELGVDVGLLDPLGHGTRQDELTGDHAWLAAMVAAELALSRALVDAGLAPDWMREVCATLAEGAWLDDAAIQTIAAEGRSGGNPVIPLVRHLGQAADAVRAGASDHIHVGATSQDILDTAAMVIAGTVLSELDGQLRALAEHLDRLAQDHRTTPMAGRTLGQQAAPTSFGFVVAGWLDAVLWALARTTPIRAGLPAQLGGAVGNLTVLDEVAAASASAAGGAPAPGSRVDAVLAAYAGRLGLARPLLSWHTNRLVVAELAAFLAEVTGLVGKIALDVTVLARTEIGEVTERLGVGEGGSSAMPHKRNPVTAVLIVSAARQTPGLLATVHGSLLADDQRPAGAWHAEWLPLRDLERHAISAITAMPSLVARLDVDRERMAANLDATNGLIFSERVSAVLTETLGKTAAFRLVEKAAAETVATNRPLQVVLSGLLAAEGVPQDLRSRVWAACATGGEHGASAADSAADRAIDRVHARYRSLTTPPPDAPPPLLSTPTGEGTHTP